MKKTAQKKKKTIVKAMISFVAILAVLTFFSNTIMNATIPRVMASYAGRSNLAYTNTATAPLVAIDEVKVKGLENRTVIEVVHTNYDLVEAGDVIINLAPSEDNANLLELQQQLRNLIREQEYAARTPHHYGDYTQQQLAIHSAELAVDTAQTNLTAAQNRDAAISNAQQLLSGNQTNLASLQAQLANASASVESIQSQIANLNSQLAVVNANIAALTNTTPVPTATPIPTSTPIPTAEPTATPAPTDTPAPTPDAGTDAVADRDVNAMLSASPVNTPVPAQNLDALYAQRNDLQNQIASLQSQLASTQANVDGIASQIAATQTAIANAQAALTEAQGLPTVYSAQDALTQAQISLNQAQIAYSDQVINDGIAMDQAADAVSDREEQIERLEQQIEELEATINQCTIVAPVSGYVFNLAVDVDDKLTKDGVIFSIIPQDSEFQVSFKFDTSVASSFSVGDEFNSDNYWYIDRIVITNIKPDPDSPRDRRIVRCAIIRHENTEAYPGENITVTADRGNATYEHVIASSAINEDNTGKFIFVIEQSSSPLGDRYQVRRVSVTVEATSGSLSAITGEGLDGVMIVTRSETPLNSGDRVRLEDYSSGN